MAFDEAIITAASKQGVILAARPSLVADGRTYLAIVDRETDRRKLNAFLRLLRNQGIPIEIGFATVRDNAFEAAVRESVAMRFGEVIYDVSTSRSPSGTSVSITYYENERISANEIRDHVQELSVLFGVKPLKINIGERSVKPGVTEFLQLTRVFAPVTCERMQELIHDRGYPMPPLDWINHQFDLFRKRGFLIRREDQSYVLTLPGLLALGSGKSRYSPDVRRVLDLARARK
ncbi:hypothetical protein [Pelagerythrobacter marinus]|uniref:hypothetical protein n=1 Tax=Pelagerythrobacter marinus TaxID=538382 RepID=UPI002036EAEA|nr:hypothetical protein [Pelagerythrobacter marinus]USA40187.1 hypothetical protein NCF86_03250 [Pelagerythrobacter marinus]WPZ05689.1 hypothetical protein T8T98_09625 [Pelagerythrobacter marinus]